jgi:signal transduction histidine kinase
VTRAARLAALAIERKELEDQLRDLTTRAETVREEERTGIAREIHDELGQALTALKMDLAWVARRLAAGTLEKDMGAEKLRAMSNMTDDVIQEVRRISAELRPGVLDDLGFVAAAEWQARRFEERTEIACVLRTNASDVALDRDVATAAFRILQEALTNVARHASASEVVVRVEADARQLVLEIVDDGRGISEEEARSRRSLGVLGMRERARRFGGSLEIGRASPRGTRVALTLPRGDASR